MAAFKHESGEYFEIEGARIYVEQAGVMDGEALVFLHGGLGSIEDFLPVIERFAKKYRCVGIDSRGHGMSMLGVEALSYERLMKDANRVLDALGISSCDVIGFSDGGTVGYRLAIENKGLVKKLVTIGSDWNVPVGQVKEIYSTVSADDWREQFPGSVKLYEKLNPEADFDGLMKSIVAMWLDEREAGYPGDRIKGLESELLFVRGDEDFLVPRELLVDIGKILPGVKCCNLPMAGHAAQYEQGEILGQVIEQFLAE
ncbi:alpha/beta hydrolase [Planctomycetota bacterium]|nr:alpha/beta hydrolase [Planctomycetota bacterium]